MKNFKSNILSLIFFYIAVPLVQATQWVHGMQVVINLWVRNKPVEKTAQLFYDAITNSWTAQWIEEVPNCWEGVWSVKKRKFIVPISQDILNICDKVNAANATGKFKLNPCTYTGSELPVALIPYVKSILGNELLGVTTSQGGTFSYNGTVVLEYNVSNGIPTVTKYDAATVAKALQNSDCDIAYYAGHVQARYDAFISEKKATYAKNESTKETTTAPAVVVNFDDMFDDDEPLTPPVKPTKPA